MALYQSHAKALNDFIHGVAAAPTLTAAGTGSRKVRAFTAAPTATGGGTQVAAGGGYATGGTTMDWGAATTATPSVSSNLQASWTNWPRTETVTAIDITDAQATPVIIEFGTLTSSKAMAAGDTLTLQANAVTSSLQ